MTIANIEIGDVIGVESDNNNKGHPNKNSLVIMNPNSISTGMEVQINANYENALQIVKANVYFFIIFIYLHIFKNMRRKKLEALIEIDSKL